MSDAEECAAKAEALEISNALARAKRRRRQGLQCSPSCWCKSVAARIYYARLLEDLGAIDESPGAEHQTELREGTPWS